MGVVALFGAGVVVVRATLKVELEISEKSIAEIQHWRYLVTSLNHSVLQISKGLNTWQNKSITV